MLTFEKTVEECLKCPDFVKQYRRLRGARLGLGSPLEKMIDEATGFSKHEWNEFFDFVRDYVFMPTLLRINHDK